jgi:hypothetical protein
MDVVDSRQECLQVKISGSNFDFSFAVNCDGESANKNYNNNGGNVRSSSSDDAKSSSAASEDDDIDLNAAAGDENEEL